MRTIDADALKALFDEIAMEQPDLKGASETLGKIIDFQPTIYPAANWTPCSVALPEKGVYVLGYLRTKEMKNDPMLIICKYDESEDDDCFFDRDGWHEDIIAWQPLPSAYEGGNDD